MHLVTKIKDVQCFKTKKNLYNGDKDSRQVKIKFKQSFWLEFHWKARRVLQRPGSKWEVNETNKFDNYLKKLICERNVSRSREKNGLGEHCLFGILAFLVLFCFRIITWESGFGWDGSKKAFMVMAEMLKGPHILMSILSYEERKVISWEWELLRI